jgi:hypothetical protein
MGSVLGLDPATPSEVFKVYVSRCLTASSGGRRNSELETAAGQVLEQQQGPWLRRGELKPAPHHHLMNYCSQVIKPGFDAFTRPSSVCRAGPTHLLLLLTCLSGLQALHDICVQWAFKMALLDWQSLQQQLHTCVSACGPACHPCYMC